MPESEALRYARALQAEAKSRDFDPLTGVAIIHSESGWRPSVVSRDGEDYGLGQIRARYIGACKEDADPLHNPSPECEATKQSLLEPETNIRVMGMLITRNRAFCSKKTGTARFHQWLASYQGRNDAARRRWCRPGEGTWKVIRYRQKLLTELARGKVGAAKKRKN